eukprot:TRINITY_DN2363_c0_g1_i4.p3 TRINITY_DN2363_c0_g1~~TRINITY_DN2363_c0_g1_i4.p3  ORF type:complete len:147 (+),score=45.77 TRINITY_DN2363_c0_g1_i4:103-543(+)
MAVQSLFVVNKAGGLMFQRTYGETAPRLTPNDYLHLASTFHGMQLLVQELSPSPLPKSITAPTGGIRALETPSLSLAALTSPTGVQFFVTADVATERLGALLAEVYRVYADVVMKNPFYVLDMPIRCERWESAVRGVVERHARLSG